MEDLERVEKEFSKKLKNTRPDIRNVQIKVELIPSPEMAEQMMALLRSKRGIDPNAPVGTMSGSGPDVVGTIDEVLQFLQMLKHEQERQNAAVLAGSGNPFGN